MATAEIPNPVTDSPEASRELIEIFVNTRPKEVHPGRISFDEVVKLAYPIPPPGQLIEYEVTYRNGPPPNRKGTLIENQSVVVGEGMIFVVTATDKS